MKKLLRTLYILTPDSYLYWRNENVCIKVGGTEKVAIPALTLDAIVPLNRKDCCGTYPILSRNALSV